MAKKKMTNLPSESQVEKFERLSPLLESIFEELKELSKKKPDGPLNQLKVKMINRVLEQVREFLSTDPNIEFLNVLDDETLPTNSDAVLIIGQFRAVLNQFKSKFYGWDSGAGEDRWFTKKNPPSR